MEEKLDQVNNIESGQQSNASEPSKTGLIAAMAVTPSVKHALITDTRLNDDEHVIDVDYREGVVTLTGHVKSEELRERAGAVAQRALDDIHVSDKVRNELAVDADSGAVVDIRE